MHAEHPLAAETAARQHPDESVGDRRPDSLPHVAPPGARLHWNVAWTGHRPELFADPPAVAQAIGQLAAAYQAAHGAGLVFHGGGQRGVDTWAASAAQALGIALHLYLPLPIAQFAADWPSEDWTTLERLWAYAAERVIVDPTGVLGPAAYRRRNRLLAAHADVLVAVWTGRGGGGTAETIALARALGRPVEEHRFPASGHLPRPGERGV